MDFLTSLCPSDNPGVTLELLYLCLRLVGNARPNRELFFDASMEIVYHGIVGY